MKLNEGPGQFLISRETLLTRVRRLGKFAREEKVLIEDQHMPRMHIRFFSNRYRYSIICVSPDPNVDNDGGYLGGSLQCLRPRENETWLRGSDLHDGPHTIETLERILFDMLSSELVPVPAPQEQEAA